MSKEQLVSPKGIVKYIYVSTPNKFGDYVVDLLMAGEDAENFKKKLDDLSAQARKSLSEKDKKAAPKIKAAPVHVAYKAETDEEGNETGNTIFSFKNKAKGKKKDGTEFTVKIDVVDAKLRKVTTPIGRGSTIKVAFTPTEFFGFGVAGASLRLQAVQVIDLVPFNGSGAAAFSEEEGYVADEVQEPAAGDPALNTPSDY